MAALAVSAIPNLVQEGKNTMYSMGKLLALLLVIIGIMVMLFGSFKNGLGVSIFGGCLLGGLIYFFPDTSGSGSISSKLTDIFSSFMPSKSKITGRREQCESYRKIASNLMLPVDGTTDEDFISYFNNNPTEVIKRLNELDTNNRNLIINMIRELPELSKLQSYLN